MSLIDEALKRAELEAARRDGLRGGAYPWVPEHMPRRRRGWGLIAAAVVGLGLAVAGAVWLVGRPAPVQGPKSEVQSSPSQKLETVEVAPAPVGLPSRVVPRADDDANAKAGKEARRPTPPFDTARARIAPAREPGAASAAAENKPARGLADGKTYAGKDQVKKYWQAAGPFQPQNQWVGYTPAFRIKYSVKGDTAHLYFECLWVDKLAGKIAAHTNSDDDLVRVRGRWLIRSMKAGAVPDL